MPLSISDLPEKHKDFVTSSARQYFAKKRFRSLKRSNAIYDLAILSSPAESSPPSDVRALKHFVSAAEAIGLSAEIITKDDFSKIPEFDALFIRDTTAVNHYTYRFAQRAQAEGLEVIDDPQSIVKCTNKVYLAELLIKAKIPRPKTLIVHKDNCNIISSLLGFPCVLKQPDSSFSQGVVKVNNRSELQQILSEYLNLSDLIIAQEYMPTTFDWRIGILDREPIFACQYFMAKGHWQILNWQRRKKSNGQAEDGDAKTFAINQVPEKVLKTAVRAANLVGSSLYGVDLKEKNGKVYVVEINDNPSINFGVEDDVSKDKLYLTIMKSFLNRIKQKKGKVVD
jgi:glutathione synthase/RimK-type ligase-like ATP-grasp enzyme